MRIHAETDISPIPIIKFQEEILKSSVKKSGKIFVMSYRHRVKYWPETEKKYFNGKMK